MTISSKKEEEEEEEEERKMHDLHGMSIWHSSGSSLQTSEHAGPTSPPIGDSEIQLIEAFRKAVSVLDIVSELAYTLVILQRLSGHSW